MNARNRVKVRICGSEYALITTDSEEYVIDIAFELDEAMKRVLETSPSVTQVTAAVLTAIDYIDRNRKLIAESDNLRAQLNEYVSENIRLSSELEQAKSGFSHPGNVR